MSDFIPKTNHVVQGLSRLLAQFKGKPRMTAFLTHWLEEIQELDTQIATVSSDRFIDAGYGVQLDGIGEIVGEARQGVDDTEYKAFLRARARVNNSNGKLDELLKIVALIQGSTAPGVVRSRECYPCHIRIEPTEATVVNARRVSRLLHIARPGGVSLHFVYSKSNRADTLIGGWSGGSLGLTSSQCPGWSGTIPNGSGKAAGVFVAGP